MLADPQSIKIGTVETPASRVLTGTSLGKFVSADQSVALEVQTAPGRRIRTVARVIDRKVVDDPLTGTKVPVGSTIALTINRPDAGYSDDEVVTAVKNFFGWMTASTDAVLKQIVQGQN